MSPLIIPDHLDQDQLLSNVPEDHQEDPGEVVAVVPNPLEADQVSCVIAYLRLTDLIVASDQLELDEMKSEYLLSSQTL